MTADARDQVKALWQQQAPERRSMTLEQVLARARQLDDRGRKRRLAGYAAGSVAIASYGFALSRFPNAVSVAGGLLVILAVANLLYQTWVSATPAIQGSDGVLPGVDFYRRRLTRQRDAALARWRRLVLPIAPGFIVVIIGLARGGRAGWLPLTLIGAAAAYVFIRIRVLDRACARAHQLDLDMLDRMEDRP